MNNTTLGNDDIRCVRSVAVGWTEYHYLNPTLVTVIAVLSLILGALSTVANGLVLTGCVQDTSSKN